MSWLFLVAAVGLIAAAIALRRRTGLPWRRIAYDDTTRWRQAEQPLIARRFGLVGKPDYLLEARGQLVPVEVKPNRTAPEPYPSDVMQLAAYCLLIEETSGVRPRYGLLRYAHTTWKIPFDNRRRDELITLIEEMRMAEETVSVRRSHQQAARCAQCSFRTQCDEALA
jgi:CRISPR-associated exonuclease Cas4